ncbi:AAA family ATPase [Bosea sp. (in: a-proteobacteria)]|jgi:twinkle protein|uniref:AAA family ATPase n=1 Tax=Bosea sp. (in: a-proteobacteria) TaxID=1871050 RepID=UPI002DDD7E7E|nr:AAA family ATPase [Bosea sp. (in: a-proteobacteria)]HEV2508621.1 AAA family ATPase [Bosea sp. (in: a-proteobacteria)]
MEFIETAKAEGIRLRSWQQGNHKATCPCCSHLRKKKTEPCLSVTVFADRVRWNCHHCQWTGGAGGQEARRAPYREVRMFNRPVRIENPERPDKMLAWFAGRGISAATVERMGIYRTRQWFPQIDAEANCIAFPYEWAGALRNVKYRDNDKNFRQEKNPEPVLYNADAIKPGEDLIFVEGEMDVLAFIEAGLSNVVSLPNGAPEKPESSDRRYDPLATHAVELEAAGRILIATDMDGPGELLAQELARRIGKDRCWRIRFPDSNDVQTKDGNECLMEHGAQVLRECVASAEPWPVDGLYGVDDFSETVWATYRGQGLKPLTVGMGRDMDQAFKVLPGQFVVVTGIPNHGKSRWLDQVAVSMSDLHGWRWAMFSPETGSDNHIIDLCEIKVGLPFHEGPTLRMDEKELHTAMRWVREHVAFIDSGEHTPSIDWVLEKAKAAVLRKGINALIIDPYNELEASRPERMLETEFVSQLISKCKRFAKVHGVTVFMVAHPTKISNPAGGKEPIPGLYDIAGSAHWRNKADAGLVVYRDFEERCTMVISRKIRRQPICGHPGAVKFWFMTATRRFDPAAGSYQVLGEKSEPNARRAA